LAAIVTPSTTTRHPKKIKLWITGPDVDNLALNDLQRTGMSGRCGKMCRFP
jgi:hypothetical protein